MPPEERQLVPLTSLKRDLAIHHVKEAPPAQPQRILPFENGPLAVLEDVLGMQTIVADANPVSNIVRMASLPRTGDSAT